MIRLLLLLLGTKIVQRQWLSLAALGAIWGLIGLAIIIDALDGETVIKPSYFGYFLLLEGFAALLAGFVALSRRSYYLTQAGFLVVPAIVIIFQPPHSNFIIAMILGTILLLDGSFRILSAYLVRFKAWHSAISIGIIEILFAIGTLNPWPTGYEGTIGVNVGSLLLISGIGTVMLARRLRELPLDGSITTLFGSILYELGQVHEVGNGNEGDASDLIVHVWTPSGSAKTQNRRPLIDRYVAAVDQDGVISTGHAALELAPDMYISHYPAIEIDRSPDEFTRILRASLENNVPGRYQPNYKDEAAGWTEATEHVHFTNIDRNRLRDFWKEYAKDNAYNLTSRNCSSVVAHALDAALEGVIGRSDRPWRTTFQALYSPELWAAGVLRKRAEAMAWTPGLVLDYARLLQIVVEPHRSKRHNILSVSEVAQIAEDKLGSQISKDA